MADALGTTLTHIKRANLAREAGRMQHRNLCYALALKWLNKANNEAYEEGIKTVCFIRKDSKGELSLRPR